MSRKIGISEETIFQWIKRFPEFNESIKKGKQTYDADAEDALEKMMRGYYVQEKVEEITECGGKVTKHVKKVDRFIPPNITAIIFYLKARGGWNESPDNIKKLAADIARINAETQKIELQMAYMRGEAEEIEDVTETDLLIYGSTEEKNDQLQIQ